MDPSSGKGTGQSGYVACGADLLGSRGEGCAGDGKNPSVTVGGPDEYQFLSDNARGATAKWGVKSVSILARKA